MNKTRSARWIYQVSTAIGLAILVSACASDSEVDFTEDKSEVADEQSEHSNMLLRYCKKLYDAKDLYVAASMCRRAYTVNPTDPAPLHALARIYGDMGATESKAEAYKLALQIDPDDVEALYGLGKTSIDQGRYDIAVAQLERAIALDPGDARFYNAMGVAKDQLGEHETAQTLYREGLSIDSDNVSLRNNLGLSMSLSGKNKESIAMLREVAKEPAAGAVGSRNLALAATNAANAAPDMAMDGQMEDADGDPMSLTSPEEEMGIAMGDETAEGTDAPEGEDTDPESMAEMMAAPKSMDGGTDEMSMAMDESGSEPQGGAVGSSTVSLDNAEQGTAEQDAGASMPTSSFSGDSNAVPTPEKIRSQTANSGGTAPMQSVAAPSGTKAPDGTSYTVQVGSYGSEQSAEKGWGIISKSAEEILGGVQHNIVQADLGADKGTVYRLRAGNMADKASADSLCAELSDRDIGCFVVRLPEAAPAPVAASTPASTSDEPAEPVEPKEEDAEG